MTLTVSDGEAVALIGANGAGKTSLLRAISGLITPASGQVSLDNRDITGAAPHLVARLGVAHIPEGRRVFGRMTVTENLLVGAESRGTKAEASMERVYALFPRLLERGAQLAGTLSGGEQQMLAIGRALMGAPRFLLMDEPSLGLSPLLTQNVFKAIAQLHQSGVALLIVEQNARQALRLASRGYVLRAGELQLEGPSGLLAADVRVQQMYLGTSGTTRDLEVVR
jgi:branched-chain amino acid transport system ATP-binding protein